MKIRRRDLSLRAKLTLGTLLLLAAGGLVTSLVGSWITSSAFTEQAVGTARHDLAAFRALIGGRLDALKRQIAFAARACAVPASSPERSPESISLPVECRGEDLDFLLLADTAGRPVSGTGPEGTARPEVPSGMLSVALRGRVSAAPETLDPGFLVLAAAAPVRAADGGVSGVLFGGVVLTGDTTLVDGALDLFSDGGRTGTWAGRTSLFLGDRRVSTTLRSATGERELESRADPDVARAVLERGETWSGAVRAGEQSWVAAYAPLVNASGERIGMIAVGVPSAVWIGIRNRVIVSFYLLATVGFLLIAALTWRMIGQITRPLDEMVEATRGIAAGRLDQAVATPSQKEIGALAASFNEMTERLREMKKEQGEWARTLAERVRERTEEVVALQGRISQSERLASVGMLAAGVAHEINNPLGGILALTSLTLEDLPGDAPDRENLEEVVRQAERCRDIVKGLLEFSRQSQVHAEPGDLDGILDAALALLRRQALFFNVEIVRERGADLPPVFVDRTKLEEVFLNVLVNAAQAMDGRGTIRISTRAEEDGDRVSIRIQDTGRGIPPEQLPHVFDPFFTTRTGGEGTGLGLAIAYGIVTEHRGTISVESEPGRGTTFTIRLPVSRYAETVRSEAPSVS